MKTNEKNGNLHITEGVSGTWFYHLSEAGVNGRSLCGAMTMNTSIPLASWGAKGHLEERYCAKCERAGESALRAVDVSIRQ